jgi:hypothetical protein
MLRYQGRICPGCSAHPQPNHFIPLDDGILTHKGLTLYVILPRDPGAGPLGVEFEAVITTPDDFTIDMSVAQRHRTVTAAILQRTDGAATGSEQHDALAEKLAPQASARLQVCRKSSHVPNVSQEHAVALLVDGMRGRV